MALHYAINRLVSVIFIEIYAIERCKRLLFDKGWLRLFADGQKL